MRNNYIAIVIGVMLLLVSPQDKILFRLCR